MPVALLGAGLGALMGGSLFAVTSPAASAGATSIGIDPVGGGILAIAAPRCADGSTSNYCLDPSAAQAGTGSEVTWVDRTHLEHRLTGHGRATGETLSVDVPAGATRSTTFNQPDVIDYLCSIHPTMRGTLTISGSPVSAARALPRTAATPGRSPSHEVAATLEPAAEGSPEPETSPNPVALTPLTFSPPPSAPRVPVATGGATSTGSHRSPTLYIVASVIFTAMLLGAGVLYARRW